ncbi:hypothetical protein [Nocardioides baculatus]|uniref:Fe-S cluster assembly protein HesB n=1 Tax=Nocardioides baculatus TaxID=2801337 RepID=A0ABS1LBX9_9ACTN|nr:hypothetical protein [Nocardioides baculatus]MBL0749042.1 hypothetical protein [Nocardioides baculatus]
MITMTPRAHRVVRQVTAHPRVGRRSGLRIAAPEPHAETLDVRTVAAPEPGDRIVEDDGARLYLDDEAEPRVDGHLLDAVTGETGQIHFVVRAG